MGRRNSRRSQRTIHGCGSFSKKKKKSINRLILFNFSATARDARCASNSLPVFQSSQCGTQLQQYHVDIIYMIGSSHRSSHSPKECQTQHNRLPHPYPWTFQNTSRRRSRVIQIRMILQPQKLLPITTLRPPLSRRTTLTCHHLPHIPRIQADVFNLQFCRHCVHVLLAVLFCQLHHYVSRQNPNEVDKWI